MSTTTDVTGVIGWGLRRYAWLAALFVIGLGVVVPASLARAPDQYEATAQVGPVRVLRVPNLDVLPRLATDLFQSVPTSDEVKRAAGVPESGSLAPDQLELVAAQDNIILTVVARSDSPAAARDTANVAATRFVQELNLYSQPVGSFSITRLATTPDEPVPTLAGPLAWGAGIAAGLLAGVGAVSLLLLVRRPVIDPVAAEQESGAPVLGRVTLDRHGSSTTGMTQVCHRILSRPTGMVLLVGPLNTRRERGEMAQELAVWLRPVRRVISVPSRDLLSDVASATATVPAADDEDLLIVADASPVEVVTRPERSLTLLVVREGIPRPSLHEQAQQYLDGGSAAVVLVRRESRLAALRGGFGHVRSARQARAAWLDHRGVRRSIARTVSGNGQDPSHEPGTRRLRSARPR